MIPYKLLAWWLNANLTIVENHRGQFAVYEGLERTGHWMESRVNAVESEWERRFRP